MMKLPLSLAKDGAEKGTENASFLVLQGARDS
jgi:hypothetical protein